MNKLIDKDLKSRESIITFTSTLGIVTNVLLASIKIVIGILGSSIAIVSEGMNNFADVLSSVLTLVGTKLAQKHPDQKHPFGYGRIEYLVSLVISILILITGVEMVINSVKLIFNPSNLKISYLALIVVLISAVVKFILGTYTIQMGKKADSNALIGVGVDGRNDAYASIITIASSLAFLLFHVSIDAYAGIVTSLLIIKAGFELLQETIADLLGRPGDHDLALTLYKEIRSTEGIISAVDMMLHNYGPDAWAGSVNVEIDHKKTVGEIYEFLHALQLRIYHEYKVALVFGVYAVDNDHEQVKELRERVTQFVRNHEFVKSYHAVYIDEKESKIYCDLLVDYNQKDWDGLREEFIQEISSFYPNYQFEVTVETDFV